DPDVKLIGFPEDICTDTYSTIGKFHAFADRTFTTLVQRVLALQGVRFHYGHPDVWDAEWVRQMGGTSQVSYVNEDIFGAYQTVLKGGKIIFREYIQAGKAREVSFPTTEGIFRKFGMGAGQQAYSRYLWWLNTSPNFAFFRSMSHFIGAIGFYLRKPIVKIGVFSYLLLLLLMGISGFAAFPSEIIFGILAVYFTQAISTTGYFQLVLDKGIIRGTLGFFKMLIFEGMMPFFMAHVFTYAKGVQSAMKGIAKYVKTGRGFMLQHIPIFSPEPFNEKGEVKDAEASLYNAYRSSHIRFGLVSTIIAIAGIGLWQNLTLVWSILYVFMAIATYGVPYLANPGSTPLRGGAGKWWELFKGEVENWHLAVFKSKRYTRLQRAEIFVMGFPIFFSILAVNSIVGMVTPSYKKLKEGNLLIGFLSGIAVLSVLFIMPYILMGISAISVPIFDITASIPILNGVFDFIAIMGSSYLALFQSIKSMMLSNGFFILLGWLSIPAVSLILKPIFVGFKSLPDKIKSIFSGRESDEPTHFSTLKLRKDTYKGKLSKKGLTDVDKIAASIIASPDTKHISLNIQDKQITFNIDKDLLTKLHLSDGEIAALIEKALDKDKLDVSNINSPITIALLDTSEHLFEDHLPNSFIGINKAILEIKDKNIRNILLQVGIAHEMRHEAGGRTDEVFERSQLSKDISLVSDLLKEAKLEVSSFISALEESDILERDSEFWEELMSEPSIVQTTTQIQSISTPTKISLISISSPKHYALWNDLSCESLAGDLRGSFGERVNVSIKRIREEKDINKILSTIIKEKPDILGISIQLGSLELVSSFIDKLKKSHIKKPFLVLGNQIPTYFPNDLLKMYKDYGNIVLVKGEGEESMRDLVKYAQGEKELRDIPNLAYINNGKIIHTELVTPNLKNLPYPPSVDTVHEISGNAMVQASRGCPWGKCAYCTRRSFRHGKKWEGFTVQRVLTNIENLVDLGITEIEFADDEFIGGRNPERIKRIERIADGIEQIRKKKGVNLTFRIFTRPDIIYKRNDPEGNKRIRGLLLRLKEVGLVKVFIGIEGGCESQLKRYSRGITLEENKMALKILKDLGINIDVGFIMFDPEVTVEEITEDVAFFKEQNLISYNQWPYRPLVLNEGSWLKKKIEKMNLISGRDINFIQYFYEFKNKDAERVYNIVKEVAGTMRDVAYTLKVKSKKYFDPGKKDIDTILSQKYVEEDGLIYLDLVGELAKNIRIASEGEIDEIIAKANKKIRNLAERIAKDVKEGKIKDEQDVLRKFLNNLGFEEVNNILSIDKTSLWKNHQLNLKTPVIIAHRIESKEDVEQALKANAAAVEVDVQLTEDGMLV
ncbi:MAG: radical SAM protein, partial [Candidatus Njordarchaeales archaeon]